MLRKETLERVRRGEIVVRPHHRAYYRPTARGARDECTQCEEGAGTRAVETWFFPPRGAFGLSVESRCVEHGSENGIRP